MSDHTIFNRLRKFKDVLLPEHPLVRPIRRAIELLRTTASQEEWAIFEQHLWSTAEASLDEQDILLLAMAVDHRPEKIDVTVIPTGKNDAHTRVQVGTFDTFSSWLGSTAPAWYKDLLRASLELWALQQNSMNPRQRRIAHKALLDFAKGCGGTPWCWHSHDNAEQRITDLQDRISELPVPRQEPAFTNMEQELLWSVTQVPGSLFDLFTKNPGNIPLPKRTNKTPLNLIRGLDSNRNLTEIETAVYHALTRLIPDMEELDLLVWPFLPFTLPVLVGHTLRRVLLIFRSANSTSMIPRFADGWGVLNLNAAVNEKLADSAHSHYLGEVSWGSEHVIIMHTDSPCIVRTWANATNVQPGGEKEKEADLPFSRHFFVLNYDLHKVPEASFWKIAKKFREEEAAYQDIPRKVRPDTPLDINEFKDLEVVGE